MNDNILKIKWDKGVRQVFPSHPMVQNWLFREEEEAALAHSMAVVAKKNGMTVNDLQHLFPAVLRMLNSNDNWSK
jgi:hypothetical protein